MKGGMPLSDRPGIAQMSFRRNVEFLGSNSDTVALAVRSPNVLKRHLD